MRLDELRWVAQAHCRNFDAASIQLPDYGGVELVLFRHGDDEKRFNVLVRYKASNIQQHLDVDALTAQCLLNHYLPSEVTPSDPPGPRG
jgi:hypothetical protein